MRPRIAGNIGVADERGYAKTIGKGAAERRISVGLRSPNVMV